MVDLGVQFPSVRLSVYLMTLMAQYNRQSRFLIRSVSFVSKGNLYDVYFTTLQLGWRQRISPYISIKQIISHCLWDHWDYCATFEYGVMLMYTLEGVSSVANFITPIF